jgi:hypothetical protein
MAVIYITVGALILVWSTVWYLYHRPMTSPGSFWCAGFFLSGLVLLIIGLALGRIGRSAREAELPPDGVSEPAIAPSPAAIQPPPLQAPAAPPTVPPVQQVAAQPAPAATVSPAPAPPPRV